MEMKHSLKTITHEFLNQNLEMTLLLTGFKEKKDRNGKIYADLMVQDRTMRTELKMWNYSEHQSFLNSLQLPAVVHCLISVGEYRNQIQLTVIKCERNKDESIMPEELIRSSKWEPESMKSRLNEYVQEIQSNHIRQLVKEMVFSEPWYDKFCTYPAAQKVHHNYLHGILQHTLEVLHIARTVAKMKKVSGRQMDRLLAMAFLHDWAKIIEYEPAPSDALSTEGRMLGHIFVGAHYTKKTIERIEDFPEEDALIILNGILGHHGSMEWGSPVLPKTVEAQILHQADKISGDVESIQEFVDSSGNTEDVFTEKLWNMGTDYYLGGAE